MSPYTLRHDEANCIACQACEVHCKSNKNLGPVRPRARFSASARPRSTASRACGRSSCPASIARTPGASRPARPAPCSSARRTGSSLSSPACALAARPALPPVPGERRNGIRSPAKLSSATTARIASMWAWKPACVTKCVTACLSFDETNEVPDPRRERYARQLLAEQLPGPKEPHEQTSMLPVLARRKRSSPGGIRARRRLTLGGALPGLARAQSLTPLQRLHRIQESDLSECGGAGEPVYLAWRQFLRGRGPSTLVIDATDFDPKGARIGRRPRWSPVASGRGPADCRRSARQPHDRAAPPGPD